MITHEIQPNLALFELSQITSSVFFVFFVPAPPPFSGGAPRQPSATLISKDLEKSWGAASLPQVSDFQVVSFEGGAERGPSGPALDKATFPPQTSAVAAPH